MMQYKSKNWNELTTEQIVHVYAIIMNASTNLYLKYLNVFQYLNQITDTQLQVWETQYPDNFMNNLVSAAEAFCQSLFMQGDTTKIIDLRYTLTKNPYPEIENLYGPNDGLDGMTLGELGQVFTAIDAINRDQNYSLIPTLLGTIYRPGKPETPDNLEQNYQGDRRKALKDYEASTPQRATKFETIPELAKQVLFFWLVSCQKTIIEDYPGIFKSGSAGSDDGQSADYAALMLELAGGIVNLDRVAEQPYYNAFYYLEHLERRREQERLDRLANR